MTSAAASTIAGGSTALPDRLKTETAELHRFAESRPLQKLMVQGQLPRPTFAAYLVELFFVHRRLEAALREAAAGSDAVASMLAIARQRERDLLSDLHYFGADPFAASPCDATNRVLEAIDRCAAAQPVSLIGMLYVLEGSLNGSRFIARAVSRAYDIHRGEGEAPPGLKYLDPYGDAQPALWQRFRAALSELVMSEPDASAVIAAAAEVFRGIAAISDAVLENSAVSADRLPHRPAGSA